MTSDHIQHAGQVAVSDRNRRRLRVPTHRCTNAQRTGDPRNGNAQRESDCITHHLIRTSNASVFATTTSAAIVPPSGQVNCPLSASYRSPL
jgi:hypothetical protein